MLLRAAGVFALIVLVVVDGACLGMGPCPPKPVEQQPHNKTAVPEYGVRAHTDTCTAMLSLDAECGNQTVGNSCGRCEGPLGVSCVSGNRKGPDDASICCTLWLFDGYSFDYGGECKNERGSTNFTFNRMSHDHYLSQWNPVLGSSRWRPRSAVMCRGRTRALAAPPQSVAPPPPTSSARPA